MQKEMIQNWKDKSSDEWSELSLMSVGGMHDFSYLTYTYRAPAQ